MSLSEGVISIGLIALVLRQLKGRELTVHGLLWPVGLVLWGVYDYFGRIPNHISDIFFVGILCLCGLLLGIGCGLLTLVYGQEGMIFAKASPTAATLWIIGMSSRLVFGIYALHGGAPTIGEISLKLQLHSQTTWANALVAMALCEVFSRTAILFVRRQRVRLSNRRGPLVMNL
ncbi:DUF1453 domain-containing protein [Corynebacterium poyangense]|uniref:DUF1453 domain-containing protein n=1 Tax=Corynebacterium poyangense TaxID=2684405 RepID=A0A7H0SRJ0_9CORY|nr:DUF1453 domain-containing protein [Corynebacterium poyangense]QNQ91165.1 DUF1453 domain-containing protein [Corynebacterium poyangense]